MSERKAEAGKAWVAFAECEAAVTLRGELAANLAKLCEEAFVAGYAAGLKAGLAHEKQHP